MRNTDQIYTGMGTRNSRFARRKNGLRFVHQPAKRLFLLLCLACLTGLAAVHAQDPPVANDITFTVKNQGDSYLYVLMNDEEGDDPIDPSSIEIVTGPEHGDISFYSQFPFPDGVLVYELNEAITETTDSFTYRVSDTEERQSNIATVTINIVEAFDFTVANNYMFVGEGVSPQIDLTKFVAYPFGVDETSVHFLEFSDPDGIQSVENGILTYQHPPAIPEPFVLEYTYTVQSVDETYSPPVFGEPRFSELVNVSFTVAAGVEAVLDVRAHFDELTESDLSGISDFRPAINEASITIIQAASKGTAVVDADDESIIYYTAEADVAGSDEFIVQGLKNNGLPVVLYRVQLNILANASPLFTAVIDEETVVEGDEFTFQFEADDPDGDDLSFSLIEGGDVENVSITQEGFFTFSTETGQAGEYEFTVEVSDGLLTDEHSFTVYVLEPGAPVANDDEFNVWNGGDSYIYVLLNDEEGSDLIDPLSLEITDFPEHADGLTVGGSGNGEIVYELSGNPGETTDSFTYRVRDTEGRQSNIATVTLNLVDAFNTQTVFEGPAIIGEGVPLTADLDGYLIYPLGFDFNTFELLGSSDPALTAEDVDPETGILTYSHPAPLPGPESIEDTGEYFSLAYTFTVQNADGIYSPPVTNWIFFTPFANVSADVAAGSSVAFDAFENYDAVNSSLGGDFPIDPESIVIVEGPGQGTAQLDPDNQRVVEYGADSGASGTDELILSGKSQAGDTNPTTLFRVMIEITEASNQPPELTVVFNEETIAEGDEFEFQFVADDPDGDELIFTLTVGGDVENASMAENGLFSFTPVAGQAGSYDFTVEVSDGELAAEHDFTIVVLEEPNDPPAFTATFDEETITEGDEFQFQFEAEDPDGDVLAFSLIEGDEVENASITEEGLFTFNPDFGQAGEYEFTVEVSDGELTDEHEFKVIVEPTNRPPVFTATFDEISIDEGDEFQFQFEAEDPDGDELTFSLINGGDVENASITEDGLFTFNPDFSQAGVYDFTAEVSDGDFTDEHEFMVLVGVTNRSPEFTVTFDEVTIGEDVEFQFQFEADDPDDDGLTFSLIEGGDVENVSITEDGLFTFEPDFGQAGEYTFSVQVSDGELTAVYEFSISVTSTNRPPVFTVTFNEITIAEGDEFSFQFEAEDPDEDELTFSLTEGEETENVLLTENGLFTFEPDFGQAGEYDFTVGVSDGELTDQHFFSVTVEITNRPPVAEDVSASTRMNIAVTINLEDFVSDPDGDQLEITQVSSPQNGQAVLTQGSVTYTPAVNFTGADLFTYTVSDEDGATDSGIINVEILSLAFSVVSLELPENSSSRAFDISDQGHVVGIFSGQQNTGFLWFDGSFQQLNGLSQAYGVNNSGMVAGITVEFDTALPALINNGALTIGGTLGGKFGALYDINNSGVGAGTSEENGGKVNGFTWDGSNFQPKNFEGADVQLFGINDHGETVGFVQYNNSDEQAIHFSSDDSFHLLSSGPDPHSRAFSIGNNGRIAGVTHDGSTVRGATWHNGSHKVLAGPGGSSAIAYGVNDSGVIVGASSNGPEKLRLRSVEILTGLRNIQGVEKSVQSHSFNPEAAAQIAIDEELNAAIWLEDEVLDLNELLPAGSGWHLIEARAVNNHMQIVGYGLLNGNIEAFLITPAEVDEPVAESAVHDIMEGMEVQIDIPLLINGSYGSVQVTDFWGASFGFAELRGNRQLNYRANYTAAVDTVYFKTIDGRGAIAEGTVIFNISNLPDSFELSQNYPNPFNSSTIIPFQLAGDGKVNIELYNIEGRRVATVLDQDLPRGLHRAEVRNLGLSSGVYFYRMRVTNASGQVVTVLSRKMVLLK